MERLTFGQLTTLAGALPDEVWQGADPMVTAVSAHSDVASPGSMFVCMPSASRDTHALLAEVFQKGASSAVVHSKHGFEAARALGLSAWLVDPVGSRFNFSVGRLCRAFFGDPSLGMRVIGVTGTNGKTTTAWMVCHALRALGRRSAYLGTLGVAIGEEMQELGNTTPFPVELWSHLDMARSAGCSDFVLEASSHALFERRLAGVQFDVGAFTNLTQDHLDFHGTMEAYAEAKKLLFTEYAAASTKPFTGVVNKGDGFGNRWAEELPCRVLTYGREDASLTTAAHEVKVDCITMGASYGGAQAEVRLKFGGLFNVENARTALASLVALGYPLVEAMSALETVAPVPGRFEPVTNDMGIGVIVDYAHTPDALDLLLRSVRSLGHRRVITVFGCGGDRDRTKRPKMGAVVSRQSDIVVVTSDNPRTEDPGAILKEIVAGLEPGSENVEIIDRREAIGYAVGEAEPGDIVVIAGKGHEGYQIIGKVKYPMDDRVMAREALEGRG